MTVYNIYSYIRVFTAVPRKWPDDKNGPAAAADNYFPQEDDLEIHLEFDDLTLVNDEN